MHTIKLTTLLAGLFAVATVYADVPVIDAYQDSGASQTSSAINSSSASSSPSSSVSATQIAAPTSATTSLPMDQRVVILERQVGNLSQLLIQFNELQQQVQDLRGKLEVQKHDLQVLQDQVRSQYQDLDQRMSSGSKAVSVKPLAKPAVVPAVKTDSAPADQNTDTDEGDTAYQAAFDLLKKKKYPQTMTAFQSFIKKYPNSKQIVNARYWLGMMYLTQGQPKQAVPQFQTIVKKYPQDAKVPDAMLQLGMAYYAIDDSKSAITTLKAVQEKYPDSTAAKYAKGRLQQIQAT